MACIFLSHPVENSYFYATVPEVPDPHITQGRQGNMSTATLHNVLFYKVSGMIRDHSSVSYSIKLVPWFQQTSGPISSSLDVSSLL